MKRTRRFFIGFLFFMSAFFMFIDAEAYIVGVNEPEIYDLCFYENNKILKTGDTLHIKFKTKNIDCDTYYRCRVLFVSHSTNCFDDITIECTYNPSTGYYEGESESILKEEMAETRYNCNFYGFYNKHPGIYGKVLSYEEISFVYSDNCYIGIHSGGNANCSKRAVCTICGREYGELSHHIASNWVIIKRPNCTSYGIRIKKCITCGKKIAEEKTNPTGHKTDIPSNCLSSIKCIYCNKIIGKPLGHNFSSWKIKRSSTVLFKGYKIRKCLRCNKIETKTINKLEPKIKITTDSLVLKKNQSTNSLKVYGMEKGDYIKSVVPQNKKIIRISNVKKTGTFKITAKKTGKTVITIKLASGIKKNVVVKVQNTSVKTKFITVPKKITLKKGGVYVIKPKITPITSTEKISYRISNNKIASINKHGKIVAKKNGSSLITVRSGSKSVKIKLIIK